MNPRPAPLFLLALLLAGCTTPAARPPIAPAPAVPPPVAVVAGVAELPNLTLLKRELVEYADSGAYTRDVALVAAEAEDWVGRRAAGAAGRLAIVFDLDETLLSNLEHMRAMDFGYVPPLWEAWVVESRAPAIEAVARVYRVARAHDVAVFYLTGRRERERAPTEANLRARGLGDFVALHLKPDADAGTTQAFKTATRAAIAAEGYTIIANIGDQLSDLAGGHAERTYKLPNPFYMTF